MVVTRARTCSAVGVGRASSQIHEMASAFTEIKRRDARLKVTPPATEATVHSAWLSLCSSHAKPDLFL
jgi:hypothetical protein